jgi:CBS domain-containing protein
MPKKPLSSYVARAGDSIEDAMALMEENRHKTVVVVDERGTVLGTLSDGDARRALLDHRLLSTPVSQVMNTNFISVGEDETAQAEAVFARGDIFVIPVIDDEGRLKNILEAY